MLHEEKVIIAQHRIPEDTNEITQVKELLDAVDLDGAVVTADAAHAQRETADYIAGQERRRRPGSGLLPDRQGQPAGPAARPSTTPSRTAARASRTTSSSTTATAGSSGGPSGSPMPPASTSRTSAQVVRIRRDALRHRRHALSPRRSSTPSPAWRADRAGSAGLARIARGQWGIESVHWLRDTACAGRPETGYAGNGPQVMATCRNIAISLLYLAGVTEIIRTLQAIGRDRTRMLNYLPL